MFVIKKKDFRRDNRLTNFSYNLQLKCFTFLWIFLCSLKLSYKGARKSIYFYQI